MPTMNINFDNEQQLYCAYVMFLINDKIRTPNDFDSLVMVLDCFVEGGIKNVKDRISIDSALETCDVVREIFKGLAERKANYEDVKEAIKNSLSLKMRNEAVEDVNGFDFSSCM